MSATRFSVAIIGAGVVGASLARALAKRFPNVILLEKEGSPGLHTSGRNSGVIHSGVNPKPGTLKARLCVEGNRQLRAYCRERSIRMEEVGTIVVALQDQERAVLDELFRRGRQNGVPDLQLLSGSELRRREPHAKGGAALLAPTGAIVDSSQLVQALVQDAREAGATIELGREVTAIEEGDDAARLKTSTGNLEADLVVNCAGVHADRLAHQLGKGLRYRVVPFRGEYFSVKRAGPPLVRSMLYHVPNLKFPFLGIHLARTIDGTVLIGPNAVPAFGREAYRASDIRLSDVLRTAFDRAFWSALRHNPELIRLGWRELQNSCSARHFFQQASRLVEGLAAADITLDSRVGIRPQLIDRNGELVEDLVIETTPHSIHVLNVISPGMTSSLAFAEWFSASLDAQKRWTEPSALVSA